MTKKAIKPIKVPQLEGLSKKELAGALKGTKTKNFRTLFHVGFLGDPTQVNGDMEGPFLSTSEYPSEWTQIAKLGGSPRWTIHAREKIHVLDVHKSKLENAKAWALDRKLAREETWWKAPADTDEEENTRYFLCKTEEDAQLQKDPDLGEVIPAEVLVAEPLLENFWSQRRKSEQITTSPWHTEDMILTLLLELAAQMGWEEFPDGIFWNELLDPWSLSAPRASLSPTRIIASPRFQISQSHEP